MKKQLTITTAMAAALMSLPACSSADDGWNDDVYADQDTAICVDSTGQRIDDDLCDDDRYRASGFVPYYIGRGGLVPYYGDSVRNARYARGSYSYTPGTSYARAPAETRMMRSAAVSRGGLGSSSRSYGGGRS